MAAVGRAPTTLFGSKITLAPRIVALLPPHETYCEPFAGSGAVFFTKSPSAVEVLSDADSLIVNFFRVLRDPVKGVRLREALTLTPYAREEWADCSLGIKAALRGWDAAADDVELARRWFVLTQMSFAGRITHAPAHESPGWRYTTKRGHNPAASYRSAIDRLPDFTARLARTQIEHDDALNIIKRFDGPRCCQYIDPPYLPDTRRGGGYGVEMTFDDHARLLDALTAPTLKGMVILSGYDSALYRERLEGERGWQRLEIVTTAAAAGRTRKSNLQGEGAVYRAGQTRTEILWLNPAAQARQGLWAALDAGLDAADAADAAAADERANERDPEPTPATRQTTRRRPSTTRTSTRKGTATHGR